MTAEDNKVIGQRLIEEVLNKGDVAGIDKFFAANYVDHTPAPGTPATLEGFKAGFAGLQAAFPDLHYKIDLDLAEGDRLVHYLTGQGTMKGEFAGMPATGKMGTWHEVHIGRLEGGKFVEHWAIVDQMGMMVSLGLMPAPAQA